MNAKELIKLLKVMPQDLPIYWADHDQGDYEVNNTVRCVLLIDQDEMDDDDKKYNHNWEANRKKYIVIRP